jgi:hypothetical protein
MAGLRDPERSGLDGREHRKLAGRPFAAAQGAHIGRSEVTGTTMGRVP